MKNPNTITAPGVDAAEVGGLEVGGPLLGVLGQVVELNDGDDGPHPHLLHHGRRHEGQGDRQPVDQVEGRVAADVLLGLLLPQVVSKALAPMEEAAFHLGFRLVYSYV